VVALAGGASGMQLTGDSSRLSPTAPVFMPDGPLGRRGTAAADSQHCECWRCLECHQHGCCGEAQQGPGAELRRRQQSSDCCSLGQVLQALLAPHRLQQRNKRSAPFGKQRCVRGSCAAWRCSLQQASAGASGVVVLDSGLGFAHRLPASLLSPSAPAFTPGSPGGRWPGGLTLEEVGMALRQKQKRGFLHPGGLLYGRRRGRRRHEGGRGVSRGWTSSSRRSWSCSPV